MAMLNNQMVNENIAFGNSIIEPENKVTIRFKGKSATNVTITKGNYDYQDPSLN